MLCVLMVEGMSVVVNVLLSLISVPPHALCNLSVRMVVKLCILGVFFFRGKLASNFFFDPVYEDLQYDEISLIFTAWSVFLCGVCRHLVVFGLSVRLSWYLMWMQWLMLL